MWESWWGFDPQEKLVSKYNVACDGNFALASTMAFDMVTRLALKKAIVFPKIMSGDID